MLDAELLAEVYLELLGGKEPSLLFDGKKEEKKENVIKNDNVNKKYREPRIFNIEENIDDLHNSFLENKVKNPIWKI